MATPQAGMITAVSFLGTANSQRVLNTLHYRMTVAWSQQSIEAYMDAFNNQIKATGANDIVTAFLDIHSTGYRLDAVKLQVVYPVRYRSKSYSNGFNGTDTGELRAQNVSVSITKRTELAGRSKVGRINVGGIGANSYQNGLITSTTLSLADVWCGRIIQQIFEVGGLGLNTPVLFHPGVNANPKFDLIESFIPEVTLRTQRTRTIGKGV